jgi:DNA-binding LacI/PurR family transcriptional regulator
VTTSLGWPARPMTPLPSSWSLVPNASRIGLLGNPDTETYSSVLKRVQDAAQKVGLFIVPIEARNPEEIENAFANFAKERLSAVIVASDLLIREKTAPLRVLRLARDEARRKWRLPLRCEQGAAPSAAGV